MVSRSEAAAALRARGLGKRFGSVVALDRVDLEVGPGEVLGIVGPNGAGKSTLIKIACGLVRPGTGTAEICGSAAGSASARADLGYLAETFSFPEWMRAEEVIGLHQSLSGSAGGTTERAELLELVGLAAVARRRVGAMSKGMQQRLGIAQALVGSPRLLLLDEPTSALDPAGRLVVRELLGELRRRGIAVLINSHLLGEIELVCDRVAILSSGRIVRSGTPAELTAGDQIEIETASGRRVYPGGRERVPGLIAELVASGESIYGVEVVGSSLERAYLDTVGEDPG